MTKKVKHTPTQHLDNVCIMQKYHDSNKVLECREAFNQSEQFIVKAVNAHDELVEALKRAVDIIDSQEVERALRMKLSEENYCNMLDDLNQALKKAGE